MSVGFCLKRKGLPGASVEVPCVVPSMRMVTPVSGSPCWDFTVPDTALLWARTCPVASIRRMKIPPPEIFPADCGSVVKKIHIRGSLKCLGQSSVCFGARVVVRTMQSRSRVSCSGVAVSHLCRPSGPGLKFVNPLSSTATVPGSLSVKYSGWSR